jgi:hypothetical protein
LSIAHESPGTTERKRDFGALAGPLTEPPDGPYRVQFQKLRTERGRGSAVRTVGIVVVNVLVEVGFVLWLLSPDHHPDFDNPWQVNAANYFVIGAVALVEGMRLINVFSLSLASIVARPVPARGVPHHHRPGEGASGDGAHHAAGGPGDPLRGPHRRLVARRG